MKIASKFVLLATVAIVALSGFGHTASAALSETIKVGRTLSVGLDSGAPRAWTVWSNTNPQAVTASIDGSSLLMHGTNTGTSTVKACSNFSSECVEVTLTVTTDGGLVLGTDTAAPHAPYTWVLSMGTVYYVMDNGVIPVSSEEIFYSNGGNFSNVVPANDADLTLPLLPLMTMNDSRVQ